MKIPLNQINSTAEYRSMLAAAEGGADGVRKLEMLHALGTNETTTQLEEHDAIEKWRAYAKKIRFRADAGDKIARKMLYEIAIASASELAEHAKNGDPLFQQFAAEQICWPVVLLPFPSQKKAALEKFDSLLVGSQINAPVNVRPIFMERENATPARVWIGTIALHIFELRQAVYWSPVPTNATTEIDIELPTECDFTEPEVITALNLPRLDCAAAQSQWLNFLWEYALRESGGTLSEHPILGEIGTARANSDPAAFVNEDIKARERRINTWERIAEAAIKKAIKDSLKSYSFL